MLEFSAKMKWPSLLRVEAILELSNGESFTLISKGSKIIELVKRIEFEVTSGETSINFKPISKKFFKTIYGAFQNKTMILQLHSGLCDFVEIDGKQYKLKGIFRSYIKEINFYCAPTPFLIGNDFKGSFPEKFKIQGITLASYLLLKRRFKD